MSTTKHIAKHLKEVYFGKNWTWSNLKEHLADVTWQQATTKVHNFNTIAALTYHIHYFVHAALMVLQGNQLDAHDKYSFDHPPIESETDWTNFLNTVWTDAQLFTELVEQLPEDTLWQTFANEKYGNYYRNLQGIVEHSHYHLGQIVIVKKLINSKL